MICMSAIWVTAAKALPQYRVRVSFSDGSAGEVDLEDFVFKDRRPIVAALRDPGAFATLRVELDTIVWANGFDLAPEFLYANKKSYAES
jgi:hypothetical protein